MTTMRLNYLLPLTVSTALCLGVSTARALQPIDASAMPESWLYADGPSQTLPADDHWWQQFGDPLLDSLICVGVANNYDLLGAQRRIEVARQTLRRTQAQYFPSIGLSASWNANRTSGVTTGHAMAATNMSYFDLGAQMQWQVDLFGKISAQARQNRESVKATAAQYDAMMVTVAANIATAYVQLRMLQTQYDVIQSHITQQKRVADITSARHEAGLASMLDVTQSLTTYYSTLATATSVKTSIASAINSLAVLVGVFPDQLARRLEVAAPLPQLPLIQSTGVPADLLRRRPDIVEAEYSVAASAAALGVARKDYLPSLSLTGSIGTMAHDAGDLMTSRSLTYSIAPTLSWTLFDGMARKAAAESARQQMMAAIDSYNSSVLTAVQEADNAMASYTNSREYIDLVQKAVEQAEKSFELSIDLYKQGLTDFINVTNAQIGYLQYSNELVAARGQALAAAVSLYQALGGGWQ